MNKEIVDELHLRLKGPIVALERIERGEKLPQIFADAALSEIKKAKKLVDKIHKIK